MEAGGTAPTVGPDEAVLCSTTVTGESPFRMTWSKAPVRLSFGFRYAAAGPIVQKEHSGWDTTCAVAKIIWPDLTNAPGPPPILQRNVDEGRIGFKTKRGFFEWDDESIAKERARYERALRKCLEIFREEGIL